MPLLILLAAGRPSVVMVSCGTGQRQGPRGVATVLAETQLQGRQPGQGAPVDGGQVPVAGGGAADGQVRALIDISARQLKRDLLRERLFVCFGRF